jgi:DNA (cytosine-5)-methyltransferase 1
MKLLDLFCKAGGASYGFHQAGFDDIVGVDIEPQPNYPFKFHQADALEFLEKHGHEFDYIHASPPCQAYSTITKGMWKDRINNHPRLIEPTRELLFRIGKPFGIENVPGAPLINPIMLCGTMFSLGTNDGSELRRHRYFEINWNIGQVPFCNHIAVSRMYKGKRIPATIGVYGHPGGSHKRNNSVSFKTHDWKDAMGIKWMSGKELAQAIPPAYTKFLGERFLGGSNT